MASEFSKRVEQYLRRPELEKVFEEALRLAKTPASREAITEAHERVQLRSEGRRPPRKRQSA